MSFFFHLTIFFRKKGSSFLFLTLCFHTIPFVLFASDLECKDVVSSSNAIEPKKENFIILGSGRDDDVIDDLREAAKHLTEVAESLGYSLPPHIMSFVPGAQMNILSSLGKHSAPHWVDGQDILRNLNSAGNILEFVTRGCDVCRSYYSDLNPKSHQISIIMHVLGHNHVGDVSNFHRAVHSDSMGESKAFAKKVEWLYEHYDHDEVSLFVQWLYSTPMMQNIVFSGFDSPNDLAPVTNELSRVQHDSGVDNNYSSVKHPKRPTANILQALVNNLPADAPSWKKELLVLFEKSNRFISGNIATKTINEGWATFSQFLIDRHSKYKTHKDLVEFGALLSGVAYPSLQNPYYIGLQGWWNLWENFKAKEENKGLSPFEVDQKFVAESKKILATTDDYGFLDLAFDQKWIDKNKFNLVRPVTQGDNIDLSKVPPQPPEGEQLMVSLSRHRDRIIRHIQRKFSARHLMFPHIVIDSFNWKKRGIIHLTHEVFEGIPLHFESAVQTLFVLTQILEKPVGLSTIGLVIVVEPSGKTNVYDGDEILETSKNIAASDMGQSIIDNFQGRTAGLVNYNYRQQRLNPLWQTSLTQNIDDHLAPASGLINYAPHAGASIWEYHKAAERLILDRIQEMIRTGEQPKMQNGKLLIPALPPIPTFQLNRAMLPLLQSALPPAPIDRGVLEPSWNGEVGQDDAATLIQSNLLPGDLFWVGGGQGQGQGEGQQGKGEGEGDSESQGDGDGDSESSSPGPGNGAGDVPISQEFWGEMLGGVLELPNIRRTNGPSDQTDEAHRGSVRKPAGYELETETVANALEKAISLRIFKNKPWKVGDTDKETGELLTHQTLIHEAISLIDGSDTQVADTMKVPSPDFEAIMVVVGDMTGSMSGLRIEMAKQLIFNIKSLLKKGYKKITIRYVGFAVDAFEFSEQDFFDKFISGGTSYLNGLTKGKEILDEYKNSTHNKYLLLVGDGEDFDPQGSQAFIRSLYKDLQFFSFAVTEGSSNWGTPYPDAIKSLQNEWPYIGVSKLKTMEDVILSLPELFPNKK